MPSVLSSSTSCCAACPPAPLLGWCRPQAPPPGRPPVQSISSCLLGSLAALPRPQQPFPGIFISTTSGAQHSTATAPPTLHFFASSNPTETVTRAEKLPDISEGR